MKIAARILNILLALLILAGLAGTGFRVLEKHASDANNFSVNVIMDYNDAVLLPGSGDPGENLETLSNAGFSALMMESEGGEYDKLTLEALRYYKLKAGFLPDTPFVAEDYVSEYLTMGANYPLLLAEDYSGAGSLSGAEAAGLIMGRETDGTTELPEEYHRRASVLRIGGTLAFEQDAFVTGPMVQSMVEAVVNDGARVLYVEPFRSENGEEILGVTLYAQLMEELSAALRPYGFQLNDQLGMESPPPGADLWVLMIALGVSAALVLLLTGFRRIKALAALILVAVLAAAALVFWFLRPGLLALAARYGALLVTPPLAMYYFIRRCRILALSNGNRSLGSVFWYSAGSCLVTGVIAVLGCLAGAMSVLDPTLRTPAWFVPTVWAVTLICTLVIGFRQVYREKDATAGEYFYAIYDGIMKNKARSVAILLICVTAALLYLFVIRPAPYSLGDHVDALIEHWLAVHPNIGLYLVAMPSIVAALTLCGRRLKAAAWVFILLGSIMPASFSVYYASAALPLRHLAIFAGSGLGLGLVLGLLVGMILSVVFKSIKFRGPKEWYLY